MAQQPHTPRLSVANALTGTLRRMHAVQRYSSLPVVRSENVAEHSWQIAALCSLIAEDLWLEGKRVDIGKLLTRAIFHDVSEALSGDIIRSYKHSSQEMLTACGNADADNMISLQAEIGGRAGRVMSKAWAEAKGKDLEGEIVALADLLCVVAYCVEEHALGNRKIDHVLRGAYEGPLVVYHTHWYLAQYVNDLFPNRKWNDPYRLVEV